MRPSGEPRAAWLASALLAAALVACARAPGEPAPRSDLVGVWDLVSVDSAALPTPDPENPEILLESLSMTLGEGGEYALLSSFRRDGQSSSSEATIGGDWEATAEALTFHNDEGPAIVEFGYVVAGDVLRMHDEAGHAWELKRRR